MRRAIQYSILVLCCAALVPTGLDAAAQRVDLVNGIGLIDYSRKQNFEPGVWVKYRVSGSSEAGMLDDYTVTILIAGEETFWGEDCFWVETLTEPKGQPARAVATLMSYAIFDDSLPLPRMQLFSRKVITDIDIDGNPVQQVTKRPMSTVKNRQAPQEQPLTVTYDTLGVDTVITPSGTYKCRKIAIKQGVAARADVGDSTARTEVREDRVAYMSNQIPITSLAREDIENAIVRKTWKVGKSQDAPTHVMDKANGAARLIGFGTGMEPRLVPVPVRKAVRSKATAPKIQARPKAGRRKTG